MGFNLHLGGQDSLSPQQAGKIPGLNGQMDHHDRQQSSEQEEKTAASPWIRSERSHEAHSIN
jgi:hypothetical protein